ncbi:hypothetical protein HY251_02790 [bacterium]|nr:hypothetical protein [bacterium]
MPDVFGTESGPPGAKKPDPGKKKKPPSRGEPDMLYGSMEPAAGEGPRGRYFQYDNESGSMMIDLPARFAKYKGELEEDLMDEFQGEPAGAAESGKTIDAWIKAWIEKKEKEDPDLAKPDIE